MKILAQLEQTTRYRALSTIIGFLIALTGLLLLWSTPHSLINLFTVVSGSAYLLSGLLADQATRLNTMLDTLDLRLARFLGISHPQARFIVFGILLALTARSAAGDFLVACSPVHGVLWAGGVTLVVMGLWQAPEARAPASKRRTTLFILAGLGLTAMLLRVIGLAQVPYGVNGDEGSIGLAGRAFATRQISNIFITGWHSFPSFYFWIVSLFQRMGGDEVLALRLPSAIAGSLTVLALYWALDEIFDRFYALVAAVFMAGFHFHLLFSRVGINNVFDGFFYISTLAAVWVAWRSEARWAYILAGAGIGFSQYFYTTGHLVPIYAVLWLILLYVYQRKRVLWNEIFAMVLTAAVITLPLALFYSINWSDFLIPMRSVSLLNLEWLQGTMQETNRSAFTIYANQFWDTALGFVSTPVRGIYKPGTPILLSLPAILFVLGCILAVLRYHDLRYPIVLSGIAGPLLAGAFSVEAPNAQRLAIAAPFLAALVALPLYEAYRFSRRWRKQFHLAVAAVLLLFSTSITVHEARFFFREAIPRHAYAEEAARISRSIGEFLEPYPRGTTVYLYGRPTLLWSAYPALRYLAPHVQGQDMDSVPFEQVEPDSGSAIRMFILAGAYKDTLPALQTIHPAGVTHAYYNPARELDFIAHILPP